MIWLLTLTNYPIDRKEKGHILKLFSHWVDRLWKLPLMLNKGKVGCAL